MELSVGNERKDGELKLVRERISTYRSQISAAEDVLAESKARIGEIDDAVALGVQKRKQDTARISVIENETDVLRSAVAALDNKIEVFERLSDEKRLSQMESADNLSEIKKNIGTLSARKEAAEERIKEISSALDKSNQRKERLGDELAAVRGDLKRLKDFTSTGNSALEGKDGRNARNAAHRQQFQSGAVQRQRSARFS